MAGFIRYLAAAVTGGLILFCIALSKSPRDRDEGLRFRINQAIGRNCIEERQGVFSRRLKDRIPDYIGQSGSSGISKCASRKELMRKAFLNEVTLVNGGKGFKVEDMSHSYPYLTREGKKLLMEIGRRYRKKLAGTPLHGSDFKVTSMTRTTEILKQLRAANSNASENSPHFYGNAFDISYVRYSSPKFFITGCDKYYLKEALAEVIFRLRAEKRCWATYEINQGCFHVVAR